MVNFCSDSHVSANCEWLPLLMMIHARVHDDPMMNSYHYHDSYWISTLNDVLIFLNELYDFFVAILVLLEISFIAISFAICELLIIIFI